MPENTRILVLKDKTVVPLDSGSGSLRLTLSLSLSFHLNGFASCIDSLIAFALQSGVKELGIKFKYSHRYFHINRRFIASLLLCQNLRLEVKGIGSPCQAAHVL
ncbi:hypothetical protein NC651_000383 [Populus alba x Populus x berolinensis]|nr:hypothetical protein NC651_000383 [Populus alba x Populus x berolinensis]